jgi:hypothetical protein
MDRIREIMIFRSGEKNMSKPSKNLIEKTTDFSTVKRTTKYKQSEPSLQRWRLRVKKELTYVRGTSCALQNQI